MNEQNLQFLKRKGSDSAKAIMIMHGYGADQSDLYPLADMIDPQKKWNWYFPNGIFEVIIAPGMHGRAWFEVNIQKWEERLREGKTIDMSGSRPKSMNLALAALKDFYANLTKQHKDIVVGGFSQGSMLATELALSLEPAPKGLVIWSGTLVDKPNLNSLLSQRSSVPFFQSHGKNDAVLGFEYAQNLYKHLTANKMQGEFLEFMGGHELPHQVLERTQNFMRSVL